MGRSVCFVKLPKFDKGGSRELWRGEMIVAAKSNVLVMLQPRRGGICHPSGILIVGGGGPPVLQSFHPAGIDSASRAGCFTKPKHQAGNFLSLGRRMLTKWFSQVLKKSFISSLLFGSKTSSTYLRTPMSA